MKQVFQTSLKIIKQAYVGLCNLILLHGITCWGSANITNIRAI